MQKKAGPDFFFGNAVLAVSDADRPPALPPCLRPSHPLAAACLPACWSGVGEQTAAQSSSAADASLSELSVAIRQAIQAMTPSRAQDIMGSWKRKEDPPAQLGITTGEGGQPASQPAEEGVVSASSALLKCAVCLVLACCLAGSGPNGIDWDLSRDVIFSCFSPLSTDTDLGVGRAFLYHMDLVPALNMYTHTHKGTHHAHTTTRAPRAVADRPRVSAAGPYHHQAVTVTTATAAGCSCT